MKISEDLTTTENSTLMEIYSARYIGDFAIRLTFSDGHMVLVDFKPFLQEVRHPALKKYLQEENFRNYSLQNGNLDWNDFEMCFPIADLYHNRILKSGDAKSSHSA